MISFNLLTILGHRSIKDFKADKERSNILKLKLMEAPNESNLENIEDNKSLDESSKEKDQYKNVAIVENNTFPSKINDAKVTKQSRADTENIDNQMHKEAKKSTYKKKERDVNAYTEDRKLDYKTGQDTPPQESKFIKVETYSDRENSSEEIDQPPE